MSNCSIGKHRHQSDVICITGLEAGYGIFSFIDINIHSPPVSKCLVVYLISSYIGLRGWRSPGDSDTGGVHLLSSEVGGKIETCSSEHTVCICRSVPIIQFIGVQKTVQIKKITAAGTRSLSWITA